LRKQPDDSVDFCFSDPPYNAGKNYEVYKDDLTPAEYCSLIEEITIQYRRISRRGMALFVGSNILFTWAWYLKDPKLIVVRKGAIGTPFRDYFYQYFALLVEAKPLRKMSDLWEDIKMPGEGWFYREERFPNPGQTSLHLTKRVVSVFTQKGETVADCFMGCGTTAVACVELGRHYAGCEINPHYIEIANERLAKTQYKGEQEQFGWEAAKVVGK